ncbi:MAG: DNA mismatch repair endonuclease MutL [Oscillospiraceae bacterium]|nr:DNA mismatch repair endonuclease MutL [Oscillospiraceae bacterium]
MPHIRQLSPHVADLIAAGEVVERPGSVVKELLENALDAGASAITVEIQSGGMRYIRVTDDGCGIDAAELPTAFLRHATSKLRQAEDLASIMTLGFRGEALAAIAAVSRLEIFSRTPESDSGASLLVTGGEMGEVLPTGCAVGTTIIVRDLFFNTPARMKFMKKDSAEATAVSSVVQHLALSHPDVSFRMVKDAQETLHTPGDGKLLSAIYAAQGRDFAMGLMPIEGESGDVKVEGFVTKPLCARGSRGMQSFFVNGRYVKSQLLTAALEEAYRNQMMKGKFPGCVVNITLPWDHVDVNVHPAKTVVKFVNEKEVFNALYYTVLDTLDGKKKEPPKEEKPAPAPVSQIVNPRGDLSAKPASPVSKPAAPAAKAAPKAPMSSFYSPSAFVSKVPAAKSEMGGKVEVRDFLAPEEEAKKTSAFFPKIPAKPVEKAAPAPVAEEVIHISEPVKEEDPQTTVLPVKEAPWRMAGEVLKTYIVCEAEDKTVWLIDKHAAHERVIFDRLKANTEPIMSQLLLAPLAVTLPMENYATVLSQLPLLQQFGFVCEDFGDGTVLLREIPSDIQSDDGRSALEELSEKLTACRSLSPDSARDALLHTMACKAAIKAGMTSDEKELAALVEKVQSGAVRYCPHGRPVAVKLTQYELEKMFKRA